MGSLDIRFTIINMKKLLICSLALSLTTLSSCLFISCSTSSQKTAYNTIATVEQTATLGVDDYYKLVLAGTVTTNGVPAVSKAYNDLQAAAQLAASVAASGTNALATGSLVIEASNLGNLITALEASK